MWQERSATCTFFLLCADLGISPSQAFEMKALRNERKYGDWTMSNGYTRGEAVRLSKEAWEIQGGDIAFSHLYLDLLAQVEDDESVLFPDVEQNVAVTSHSGR
jgi:hypothetical protein